MRSRLLKRLGLILVVAVMFQGAATIAPTSSAEAAGTCSSYASGYTTSYKWRSGYGHSALVYFYFGTTCSNLIHWPYLSTFVTTRDTVSGLAASRTVPDHLSLATAQRTIYGGIVSSGQCKTRSFRVLGAAFLAYEFLAAAPTYRRTKTVCF